MNEEEKKIIKSLEWSQQQMRLGNLPDYDQRHYADVERCFKSNRKTK